MKFEDRPALSETEKQFASAEYYDRRPTPIGVLEEQILETACPMAKEKAIPAEQWTSLVNTIEEYTVGGEYGYCMLDDKRGYMANYLYWKNVEPDMTRWWYGWINQKPNGVSKEDGSLHYKLWYPGEHIDHGYLNGKDRSGGYYALDYAADGSVVETRRYAVKLTDFGITEERLDELKDKGYFLDCAWETGEGGMHLSLNVTHKLPNGDVEKRTRTWIGYGIQDGKVVEDENACCTEKLLYDTLKHQSIEGRYLETLLPELYRRFADKDPHEV